MGIQQLKKICVVFIIIGVNYVLSLPTFGNEHVHIKVHIPNESSSSKALLKSKHPITHHAPNHQHHHVRHKVIHHYRHVRKPIKKLPIKETAALLGNLYLTKLDKPQYHAPKHVEETYLVKEEHHHTKPIEEVKTIKIIKEYEHPLPKPQPHLEYARNNVKTIKIIETANDLHQHHQDLEHQIETVKLVEEKTQYNPHHQLDSQQLDSHDHHDDHYKFVEGTQPQYHYQPENNYVAPKDEILNVLQAPKYSPPAQNHANQVHVPQVEEVIEEEQNYQGPNNYDPEDQLLHGIIEESLEIIKTNKAKNHNYQTYYGFHPPKDQGQKPQYQVSSETNYPYKKYPEVTVEQHIEYDKPSSNHNFIGHQHYGPPKIEPAPTISSSFVPHQHYGAPEQDDYDNTSNHYAVHQQYGPPKSDATESLQKYSQPSVNYQQTSSYEDKQNFAIDYQQHLPSVESPPDFNVKQNTLYDDLKTKDDFSNAVENPQAPETYTGYDSYSAGHVQGLGSGGYHHHTP
ncbi:uncharacterized protein ACRADG_007564 [Cochliomyia hominivorax]